MSKIFIVAGTRDEARNWASDARIPFSEIVYVRNVMQLRGAFDPLVAYVGTWRERKDLEEISQILKYLKEVSKR